MSSAVISVENVGKLYRLGSIGGKTLREDVDRWVARMRGRPDPLLKIGQADLGNRDGEYIWALRDVSFEVMEGEVLGIIGRNGAGKSTLLKILSRVTAPTRGEVKIRGRIASLLEVGTGFHPELTGRENIFLNGAILGMSNAEVRRKLEEIIAFSGVERFIDTPVKRYSSGMYVRLAFAVAAHLDPEILLVDEVLAVGDAQFQNKCLKKMEDVTHGGRTIFFVSHNMGAISRLCQRTLLLDHGCLVCDGATSQTIGFYLQSAMAISSKQTWDRLEDSPGNDFVRIRSVRVVDSDRRDAQSVDIRHRLGIEIRFEVFEQKDPFVPVIALYNEQGVHIFNAMDTGARWNTPCPRGSYNSTAWIQGNLLNEGSIIVTVGLNTLSSKMVTRLVRVKDVVTFQIVDPRLGDSAKGVFTREWGGAVSPLLEWTTSST